MKLAHFHFIRTSSFVRGWNGGPSPQISPPVAKFIPVLKSPPTPLYAHPPTHPLTRRPRFPQLTTAAWHSRSTFSAQPSAHRHGQTHTHTQAHAHTNRLQTLNCETQIEHLLPRASLFCLSFCLRFLYRQLFQRALHLSTQRLFRQRLPVRTFNDKSGLQINPFPAHADGVHQEVHLPWRDSIIWMRVPLTHVSGWAHGAALFILSPQMSARHVSPTVYKLRFRGCSC